jgi:hypothetical protein
MFPGDNYSFLEAFKKDGQVFLNLPGMELPPGPLSISADKLQQRLIMANHIAQWTLDYRRWARSSMTEPAPNRPSHNVDDYNSAPRPRGYSNQIGSILSLFGEAKKGDLIVVPDKLFTRRVLIGEFEDEADATVNYKNSDLFIDYLVLARRVKWYPFISELRLPPSLSEVLRIPVPISLLSKTFFNPVFEVTYGTYYDQDTFSARVIISGQDFTGQNTFDFGSLANLAARVTELVTDDEVNPSLVDYQDVITANQYQPTISLNINSPGFGNLRASTLTPLVFAAIFALASVANSAEKPGVSDVQIVNSGGSTDFCVAKDPYSYNRIWFSHGIPVVV